MRHPAILLVAAAALPAYSAFVAPSSSYVASLKPCKSLSRLCSRQTGTTTASRRFLLSGRGDINGGWGRRLGALFAAEQEEEEVPNDSGEAPAGGYTMWPAGTRLAIGGMASLGAMESIFLTYQKATPGGIGAICGASGGCADVLSGPYSQVLGVPLTIPGALSYSLVACLSLLPLAFKISEDTDRQTRSAILVLTTSMTVFAGYLMGLLAFKIGHACPWCITSAVLSASMCAVTWLKEAVPSKTKAAVTGICTALVTALGCVAILFVTEIAMDIQQAEATPAELVGLKLESPPEIRTNSSPQAMRLGKKLKALNAKMYGAYWCTHCFSQKQLMGKQAFGKVKYVECSNRGVDNQVGLCKEADVPGYPTWDIGGKLYPGEQSLEELEAIVGLDPFNGGEK